MELKPCPFCGGTAEYSFEDFGKKVWIRCYICGVQTSKYDVDMLVDGKNGKEWAAIAWNRRIK